MYENANSRGTNNTGYSAQSDEPYYTSTLQHESYGDYTYSSHYDEYDDEYDEDESENDIDNSDMSFLGKNICIKLDEDESQYSRLKKVKRLL